MSQGISKFFIDMLLPAAVVLVKHNAETRNM